MDRQKDSQTERPTERLTSRPTNSAAPLTYETFEEVLPAGQERERERSKAAQA